MSRNRIIYASQSVIVNGDFLYRVQTLGSTTSFTSEDVFELGRRDIVDVVDDVPTVAVTVETNDWGSIDALASFCNVSKAGFSATAEDANSNLTVVSGTDEIAWYHGVSLDNFGSDSEFDLWAPVQSESALGTASDSIDQTLFMPSVFVTSLEFSYTAGGNATENYSAETDSKTWFLNDARFVSQEEWDMAGGESEVILGIDDTASPAEVVATLSDNTLAFLHTTELGERGIQYYDDSDGSTTVYPIDEDAATTTKAQYVSGTNVVVLPTGITPASGDILTIRYAANAYAGSGHGDSDRQKANYFTPLADGDSTRPEDVGALRQGQIEIYLVDPDVADVDSAYEMSLRLSSCSISVSMDREALDELGHLKPYDRPLSFPVEITTTVETTAGDLETFAKFAGKLSEFEADTLDDIDIYDLLSKDNLVLIVMLYQQTDEEAGGSASNRKVLTSDMVATEYFVRGTRSTYAAINLDDPEREYPLKTVIVPNLKITEENYNLSQGENATQTFNFRSVNELYVVKGFVDMADIVCTPGIQINV